MRGAGARRNTAKRVSAMVSCAMTVVARSSALTARHLLRRRGTTRLIRSGLLLSGGNRGTRKAYRATRGDWNKGSAGRTQERRRKSWMAFYYHFEIVLPRDSGFWTNWTCGRNASHFSTFRPLNTFVIGMLYTRSYFSYWSHIPRCSCIRWWIPGCCTSGRRRTETKIQKLDFERQKLTSLAKFKQFAWLKCLVIMRQLVGARVQNEPWSTQVWRFVSISKKRCASSSICAVKNAY